MSDGGKGSTQRPIQVSDEQYAQRWDLIFSKDEDGELEFAKKVSETELETE